MTDATTGLPPGPAHDYLARLVHLTGDLPPHARVERPAPGRGGSPPGRRSSSSSRSARWARGSPS